MILIPATSHQITWLKQNLADATTYYVQAIIRDVKTEQVLSTVNLTDLGNGRFSGMWNVVQDGSGFGREIDIEKTVYTDAGYTTVSEIYGQWSDRYLIFNIANRNPSTGGHGGSPVNYKEINNIVRKELGSLHEILKAKPTELSEIFSELKAIQSGLAGLSKRISVIEDSSVASVSSVEDFKENQAKIISGEFKSMFDKLSDRVEKGLSDLLTKVEKIEADDINGNLENVVNKFKSVMNDEGNKIKGYIEGSWSRPLNISLGFQPNNDNDGRAKTIKNLMS